MGQRRKILRLSTDFLARFFGAGQHRFELLDEAVPADARVVDARFDGFGRWVDVLVESEAFDPVPEGQPWPTFSPTMRTLHDDARA